MTVQSAPRRPNEGEENWYTVRERFDDYLLGWVDKLETKLSKVATLSEGASADHASQSKTLENILARLTSVEARDGASPASVTDSAVSSLVLNQDAKTTQAIREVVKEVVYENHHVYLVDDYYKAGDTGSDTWQRAISDLISKGGRGIVQASKKEYVFTKSVYLDGIQDVTIRGMGQRVTVIKGAGSGNDIEAAFTNRKGSSRNIENLVIEDLSLDGDMTGTYSGLVRNREFKPGHIKSLLFIHGNRIPTEPTNAKITQVVIRNVFFNGVDQLPIHARGVDSIEFSNNNVFRSLDPGFVYCRRVRASNNNSISSADNGLSVSRGCEELVISGNLITDPFFAGIHVGGFNAEAGAAQGTIFGNVVMGCGIYGISAEMGASNLVITGNYIDTVYRGAQATSWSSDSNSVYYGSGIVICGEGAHGEPIGDIESMALWAKNNLVIGNTVRNAHRYGIMYFGVDGLTVTGNRVIDPGVTTMIDGRAVPRDNKYRNIGIAVFKPWEKTVKNVVVTANTIQDTRSTNLMNYGYHDDYSYREGNITNNQIFGARQHDQNLIQGTVVSSKAIGTGRSAEFSIDSDPNMEGLFVFRKAGNVVFSMRVNNDNNFVIRTADGNNRMIITTSGDIRIDGSRIGFFGSTGRNRPVVTGARGGNAALASLLDGLGELGIISNQTTAG